MDSFVDYDGYSISSKTFLTTVVDIMVILVEFIHSTPFSHAIILYSIYNCCRVFDNIISHKTLNTLLMFTFSVYKVPFCLHPHFSCSGIIFFKIMSKNLIYLKNLLLPFAYVANIFQLTICHSTFTCVLDNRSFNQKIRSWNRLTFIFIALPLMLCVLRKRIKTIYSIITYNIFRYFNMF